MQFSGNSEALFIATQLPQTAKMTERVLILDCLIPSSREYRSRKEVRPSVSRMAPLHVCITSYLLARVDSIVMDLSLPILPLLTMAGRIWLCQEKKHVSVFYKKNVPLHRINRGDIFEDYCKRCEGYELIHAIFSPTGDRFFCLGSKQSRTELYFLGFKTQVQDSLNDLRPIQVEKLPGLRKNSGMSVAPYVSSNTGLKILIATTKGHIFVVRAR